MATASLQSIKTDGQDVKLDLEADMSKFDFCLREMFSSHWRVFGEIDLFSQYWSL